MGLAKEDIEYIKDHIGEWLADVSLGKPAVVYEIELRERMVRVEEELKHQRELMKEGFEQVDKRFEEMNKRFEEMNKRFEETNKRSDKNFESLSKRMDRFMIWTFGLIITASAFIVSMFKILS